MNASVDIYHAPQRLQQLQWVALAVGVLGLSICAAVAFSIPRSCSDRTFWPTSSTAALPLGAWRC